jgi:F420-dependent oxidoreductase-like protein
VRIGLSGGGTTLERIVEQAEQAESDGFTTLWYPGAASNDVLLTMTLVGRATSTLELGTAVLQTYPTHPLVLAQRATAVVEATGRPSLTLGLGPSHAPVIEGVYGLSYAHPGRNTEEYVTVLTSALRGEAVDFDGVDYHAHRPAARTAPEAPVPVLVAALGPRMLRVAGALADGTITWMANPVALAEHVVPRIVRAAADAGRPRPRVVAGVPVAVHDDADEARAAAAEQFAVYGTLPNYRRILGYGGSSAPAEACIVGDEASVSAQVAALFEAGATDVWANPFVVGEDRAGSRARTRALLVELARPS